MLQQLCVTNADGQGRFNLHACFGVLAVDVQSPGVSVERIYVMTPGVLLLRYFQSFGRLLSMVGIVKNQFAVGVVFPARFHQRLGFKAGERRLRFAFASRQLERFGQVIKISGVRFALIALL